MPRSLFQDIRLFTLLYIDEAETQRSSIGKGLRSFKDVYIRCASNLLASCRKNGVRLEILTNQPTYVNTKLKGWGAPEIAIGASFTRDVPKGIPFYAAHFKLDAIRQLASGAFGDHVGLVDNDMVMLNLPLADLDMWSADQLFVYDISSTVQEEYGALVSADLKRVAMADLESTRWFGGEFIAGTSSAFGTLSRQLDLLWLPYRGIVSELHHIGDEMIVSAAINSLIDQSQITVTNVGDDQHRWISRWFSTRSRFSQEPLSYHLGSSILHLPADKRFIADFASNPFDLYPFVRRYKRHVRRKLALRKLANIIGALKGDQKRQLPKLS